MNNLLIFISAMIGITNTNPSIERHSLQSKTMGYTIEYTVVLPKGYDKSKQYPSLYMTDGPTVENKSKFLTVASDFQQKNQKPFIIVLVSPEHPETGRNRRNAELLANPKYFEFFISELLPEVEKQYSVATRPSERYLNGVSFGGLNSLYFGLEDQGKTFGNIAVMSPAIHPKPYLKKAYQENPRLSIRFFLSTGAFLDGESTTRKLLEILKSKDYEVGYNEVPHGHTMKNWNKNWLPMLEFFFKK
ncbi:hypothetical protein MTsPCn5_18260 [Croceitalea sp. MTPC5]|uniref:alpha/beta hydrolase n=1 Tax=Croceitalea sp. MTPC5 TaxID=3056565 RepID=UPI002B3F2FDE|nr:hypothetical protein MTsPCn5_18260 [Croceitalea sp. MTPC5]